MEQATRRLVAILAWLPLLRATNPDWGPCNPADCLDIHFMYTGKLGGRFVPTEWWGQTCDPADTSNCYGGSARRAAYVQQKKQEYALLNEPVMFLELGGSTFGGPLWEHPDYPRGRPATILQNLMPYDLCMFSPRDFLNKGDQQSLNDLAESFANRTCQFLLANVRFNGVWSSFNSRIAPWVVREMNGWKVAFVGMMPHIAGPGYNYGPEIIDLDPGNLLSEIKAGNYADLKVSGPTLRGEMSNVSFDYNALEPHMHDVVLLSSLVPSGVLEAQAQVRAQHPDVKAYVLLVGDNERPDQMKWLAEHTDFDVILREYRTASQMTNGANMVMVRSKLKNKTVIIAGGETARGVGHLKVRLRPSGGVQQWHLDSDIALDSSVPENGTLNETMNQLYEAIRRQNARPFGQLANALVGGYRGGERPPSANQCGTMECNIARVVSQSLLWDARQKGERVDLSLYNMGGVRNLMKGNNLVVYKKHCNEVLQFQNTLKIFTILGRDLYSAFQKLMIPDERSIISSGIRVAFHEPCFDYVNHTDFTWEQRGPPGKINEIERCKTELGLTDPETQIKIIKVEVQQVDWDRCSDYTNCPHAVWKTLEKGTTYRVVSTDYLTGTLGGFTSEEIAIGVDSNALCNYIAAKSPVQVESWEVYRDRGMIQHPTAEDGWNRGMLIVSVKTSASEIDTAPTCPAGKYLPPRAMSCQLCPPGTQSVQDPARATCQFCASGFYGNESGTARCFRCRAGDYATLRGSTACIACSPGTMSEAGAMACVNCQPGQYSEFASSSMCLSCPVARFTSAARSVTCSQCGRDLVTKHPASRSPEACICPQGMYRPLEATFAVGNTSGNMNPSGSSNCRPCPEGMECPMGSDMRYLGTTREGLKQFPYLKPRYWASYSEPLSVYGCREEKKCPGGDPGSACGPLLSGRACQKCDGDRFWDGDGCRDCISSSWLFPVLPSLMVPVIVTVMYFGSTDPLEKWNSWKNALACLAFIALNHYQIISLMKNINLVMPELTESSFAFWGFTQDLMSVFSTNCIGFSSFQSRMTRGSVVPLGVIALCLLTLVVSRIIAAKANKPRVRMEFAGMHNVIGNLLFTFFSGIANQALTLFKCSANPNGKSTLTEDASVLCYETGAWHNMLILGILSVIVYCVLVGGAFLRAVLIAHRHGNFQNRDFQWRWKFLFVKFRANVYWFGVVFLAKNFMINLAFVATSVDLGQLMWILTVVIIYTALVVVYMPFRYRAANILDLVCSVALINSCAYLIWFTDRSNATAEKVLPMASVMVSVMPLIFAIPAAIICVRTYASAGHLQNKAEALFVRVTECCSALVYMEPAIGCEMLKDLGEWDRLEMAQFCDIVKAEVLGHVANRLVAGHIASKCKMQVAQSQEVVNHTGSILESDGGMDAIQSMKSMKSGKSGEAFGSQPSATAVAAISLTSISESDQMTRTASGKVRLVAV